MRPVEIEDLGLMIGDWRELVSFVFQTDVLTIEEVPKDKQIASRQHVSWAGRDDLLIFLDNATAIGRTLLFQFGKVPGNVDPGCSSSS